MKTSNIILMTLIGSITFLIIAGALQLRVTGVKRSPFAEQVYATVELKEFNYLVIRLAVNVTIAPSTETKMIIRNEKGKEKPQVEFHSSGDTLFIDHVKFRPQERTLSVTVYTPLENLQWIHAADANLALQDFQANSVKIVLHNSRLNLLSKDTLHIGVLELSGENHSFINADKVTFDTLRLHLDQSEARLPCSVGTLSGSLSNDASLFAPDVALVQFRKDKSSHWVY